MKKEIRLFLGEDDESVLVEMLSEECDRIDRQSNIEWKFIFGTQHIQLLPSQRSGKIVTVGRIAIWTQDSSDDSRRAESSFKKAKKHIELEYCRNLLVRNLKIADSRGTSKNVWLGKNLKNDLTIGGVELRQSKNGSIVFELATSNAG
ncbi:MAG: hypothetical protein AAFX93_19225 [Verrucomicrobiota bacterium]